MLNLVIGDSAQKTHLFVKIKAQHNSSANPFQQTLTSLISSHARVDVEREGEEDKKGGKLGIVEIEGR